MNRTRMFAAVGYVFLVWSSAGWARVPVGWLRRHNMLRLSLALLALAAVVALVRTLRQRGLTARRLAMLLGLAVVYAVLVTRWAGTHEERIHFLEYGMAAILFARALAPPIRRPVPLFLAASALGAAAGVLDELVQRFTPGRFCDAHDMALNAAAALLGLAAYAAAGGEAFTAGARGE